MAEPLKDIVEAKRRMRDEARQRRGQLDDGERRRFDHEICDRALVALEAHLDRSVALYAASGSEVATRQLFETLRAAGVVVGLPRVIRPGIMAFHQVDAWGDLVPGAYGILEPNGPLLAGADIGAIVVPGLAFDRRGGRLGYGAGFYDRVLARFDALSLGLAYTCQIVPDVPRDAHDRTLSALVTEREIVRF